MKKTIKSVLVLSILFVMNISVLSPVQVYASTNEYINEMGETRADIIEWRYKTENGKIYKRKYNYSKEKWVGNWIFVANVVEKSAFAE